MIGGGLKSFSRVDLHVHSAYSKTGDILLSSLGIQESHTTPEQIYRLAMKRGMDFVTITDHDCIDGVLQIAHLDNVFISEEITAYFPEDRAKVHVVALDINEVQHAMIQSLRMDLYELTGYLNAEKILHFVAHPFYRMSAPLTEEHFEKMLLLFKRFEVKNGGKQLWPESLLQDYLSGLTPEFMARISDKYNFEPGYDEPWIKFQVAGSDDHGGILIASPHTKLPKSTSTAELLDHIRSGHTEACGEGGSPLAVAHSVFSVAYHHFQKHSKNNKLKSRIAWNLLGQIFDNANPNRMLFASSRMLLFLNEQMDLFGKGKDWFENADAFTREFAEMVRLQPDIRKFLNEGFEFNHENNEKLFLLLKTVIHGALSTTMKRIDGQKDFKRIFKEIKKLRPVFPALIIYLIAFKTEYRDRPLMRRIGRQLHSGAFQTRIAVFSDDTSREVVGSLVLKNFSSRGIFENAEIHVFGLSDEPIATPGKENLAPLCEIKFKNKRIVLPPVLDVLKRFSETDIQEIYLHSFGPMGILGLLAGKLLNIPVTCRYPGESLIRETVDSELNAERMPQSILLTLMKYVDHIVAGTAFDIEKLINNHIPIEKIDLIQSQKKNLRESFHPSSSIPEMEFPS